MNRQCCLRERHDCAVEIRRPALPLPVTSHAHAQTKRHTCRSNQNTRKLFAVFFFEYRAIIDDIGDHVMLELSVLSTGAAICLEKWGAQCRTYV